MRSHSNPPHYHHEYPIVYGIVHIAWKCILSCAKVSNNLLTKDIFRIPELKLERRDNIFAFVKHSCRLMTVSIIFWHESRTTILFSLDSNIKFDSSALRFVPTELVSNVNDMYFLSFVKFDAFIRDQ